MKTEFKTKIQALMDGYKEIYMDTTSKIKKWQDDRMYAADYRQEQIRELQAELAKTDAMFNTKVKEVIASERKSIIGEPAAKPADYEMKIANALEFMKLAGSRMTDDQLFGILQPFQHDPGTMMLFKNVVGNLAEGSSFTKTFTKTNNFMQLMNSFDLAEQAAGTLFNSKETGLYGAVNGKLFMDAVGTIQTLADGLAA